MNDAELLAAVIFAVVVAFYIMFMRPIQKDQERHKKEMRDLRPNDMVVTTSNFVARVTDIQVGEDGQTRMGLELTNGIIVTAFPNAIMRILTESEAQAASGKGQKGVSQ
jgi:preprotein translocase YajC subunit